MHTYIVFRKEDLMGNTEIITVKLVTVDDVRNFAFTAGKCKCSVKVCHDGYRVDGKSILGLLSINLSEPVEVIFDGLKDNESYKNEFKRWIV